MLKKGCLLRDPSTSNAIRDLTRVVRDTIITAGDNPTFDRVYTAIRESGSEIDIQTVGDVYKDISPTNDTGYTKAADVDKLTGRTVDTILEYTVPTPVTKEIKSDSPEVSAIAAVFNRLKITNSPNAKSTQKQMEDRAKRWAVDQLALKGKKTQAQSADQVLAQLIHLEYQNAIQIGGMPQALQRMSVLQQEILNELKPLLESIEGNENFDSQLAEDVLDQLASVPVKLAYTSSEYKLIQKEGLLRSGFGKTINSQGAPRVIVDWNKVARSGVAFTDIVRQAFPQFAPAEQDMIVQAMEQDFNQFVNKKREDILARKNLLARTPKTTAERSVMDRFYELYDIGVFQAAEQDALLKILGIVDADAALIRDMEDFARQTRAAHDERAEKWIPSFNRAMQLQMETMLERAEERGHKGIRAARLASYFLQMNTAFLILNPQNVSENIFSGLFHLFFTMINNPRAAKQAINTFFTVYKDSAQGGVRVGEDYTNTYDVRGNFSDRFTYKVGQRTWKGKTAQLMAGAVQLALQSFDNGFKASMSTLHLATATSTFIRKYNPNLPKGEEYIIANEALYGNNTEIAQFVDQLATKLKSTGRKVSLAEKKRWVGEYSLSNLMAGGNVFADTIDNLVRSGQITTTGVQGIPEDVLLMLRTAANSTAGKALGHESDIWALKWTTDHNQGAARAMASARQARDANKIQNAIISGMFSHVAYRFVGSSFRWMWLTISRSSFVPLASMAVIDSVKAVRDRYRSGDPQLKFIDRFTDGSWENTAGFGRWSSKNVNLDVVSDPNKQQEILDQHMAIRDRYARMVTGSIMSSVVGYYVILPALLKMYTELFGDDEDETLTDGEKLAKVSVWIQEDRARRRWFAKMLPMAAYDYMMRITRTSQSTGWRPLEREDPANPSFMDNLDPSIPGGMLIRNSGELPIWRDLARMAEEQQKAKPNTGAVFTEALVGLVNPLAIAKATVNTLEAFGFTDTDKRTDWQRMALKPDNAGEAFLRGAAGVSTYQAVMNKDVIEVAPVDPFVQELYNSTGELDFLPAVPRFSVEEDKMELIFTPEMKTEWVDLMKAKYREESANAVPNVQYILAGEGTASEKKKLAIEELKYYYTIAREDAKYEFLSKYPMETYGRPKE